MSDLVATSVAESASGSASEGSGTMRRDEPAAHTPAATATMTPALRKGGDGNHQRRGKKSDDRSHCILLHSETRNPGNRELSHGGVNDPGPAPALAQGARLPR